MARVKEPQPLLQTPADQLSADEQFKIQSAGMVGPLPERYRDHDTMDIEKESEFLSKSHGLYLEYNRAKTGVEKDWMYMVRVTVPGGGAFDARQWAILDSVADKYCDHNPYGGNSLRLTTRQNIQYHWLRKPQVMSLVQDIAKSGFYTLNGCGDNVRNVMGCPLSKFGTIEGANAFELSHQYGDYFRLPAASHIQVFAVDPNDIKDPEVQYDYGKQLLNRKFKIAFSTVHRDPRTGVVTADNCTEIRTNEVGVAPVVEGTGSDAKVVGYQVYVGGGQGEKKGKPTFAAHGKALGVFTPDQLMPGLKAIVDVHKEWGDRKNRVWARLKYVVWKQGIEWYRDQVKAEGVSFDLPNESLHPGERMLHHGWSEQESNGLWAYGAYIECGRLADGAYIDKAKLGEARQAAPHLAPSNNPDAEPTDAADGSLRAGGSAARLKSMVPAVLDAFPGTEVMVTPNQDLLFANIEEAAKEDFVAKLAEFGHGTRRGKAYSTLRVLSGACVGLPTCRLSYTDSEQFEPELMDQLEDMGYGDVAESIGITGCERQCFRPGTKTIGWVGSGGDNYGLKLGGSEDASTQGHWLTDGEKQYLSMVPREEVANVEEAAKEDFVAKLAEFGHGTRRGKAYSTLRVLSGACVGLPTCRLSYTDSEQFEPELMDQLEDMGYGDVAESIGITGCERQCFRPGTKTIGWVGSGGDNYGLKLGGSEDASTQGHWLTDGEKQYLSMVPREEVANVCAVLFDWLKAEKQGSNGTSEKLGPFVHRLGFEKTLAKFRDDPRTSALMDLRNPKVGFDPYVPESLLKA